MAKQKQGASCRTHPEKSTYDSDMYNREFPSGNFLIFVVCMMSLFRLPCGKLPLSFLAVPAGKDRRVECPCQTVNELHRDKGKCLWTFSFCSNARSFDRPTAAKAGGKIRHHIGIGGRFVLRHHIRPEIYQAILSLIHRRFLA